MPDLNNKNYYEILGIPRDATVEEIRGAYKDLARIYHPDSNYYSEIIKTPPSARDAEVFKIITHAYNTLTNPESRAEYDLTLEPDLSQIRNRLVKESGDLLHSEPYSKAARLEKDNVSLQRDSDPESMRTVADMIHDFHHQQPSMLPSIIKGVLVGVGMAMAIFILIRTLK